MQNNNELLISKRSEFRNDFLQHSASIQAVQQKAEAEKKKVQKEKEGTEMEVKKSGLNLDKSSRKRIYSTWTSFAQITTWYETSKE